MSAVLTLLTVTLDDQPLASPISARFGSQGGVLGRSDHCDLVLPDPERFISRRQAEVHFVDGGFFVRNIGSGNPILVAGQAVARGDEAKLAHGDEVRIGGYELRAHLTLSGAGPAPSGGSSKAGALAGSALAGPSESGALSPATALVAGPRDAPLVGAQAKALGSQVGQLQGTGHAPFQASSGPASLAAASGPAALGSGEAHLSSGIALSPARVSVAGVAPAWPPPVPWIEEAFVANSEAAPSVARSPAQAQGTAASTPPGSHATVLQANAPVLTKAIAPGTSSSGAPPAAPAVQPPIAPAQVDEQALWLALCEGLGVNLQWPAANAHARMHTLGTLLRGSVSAALVSNQAPTPASFQLTAEPAKSNKGSPPLQDGALLAATLISLLEQGRAKFSTKPNCEAMSLELALSHGQEEARLDAALAAALKCFEPGQLRQQIGKASSAKAWVPGSADAHAWREYVRQHPVLLQRATEAFVRHRGVDSEVADGPIANAPANTTVSGAESGRKKPK